ncbi:MAG: inositol monophosphatase family protein [Cyanobacteria bacterium P01_H01_bin.119]
MPTPHNILTTVLPQLRLAAAYAQQIQAGIVAQPDKDHLPENFFATALTDADLSIQTFVEVVLLGQFPKLRFYGEEFEKTYNTKYFSGIELGPPGEYLVTLDPIDGTRFYLDGHPSYQIILTVLGWETFEAVLAVSPAYDRYYYTLKGEGTFVGQLYDDLDACEPLSINQPKPTILLGWDMEALRDKLSDRYSVVSVQEDYRSDRLIPTVNNILTGDLCGVVLARGKFIDGAALATLAQGMGYRISDHDGSALPPLHACKNYQWPGLIMAASDEVYQDLLMALKAV